MERVINPPYLLPFNIVKEPSFKSWTSLFSKLMKEQAIKGEKIHIESDCQKLITEIWQAGYSKGLADMDKMHNL